MHAPRPNASFIAPLAALLAAAAFSSTAVAQTCTPFWDGTIGTPGVTTSTYVGSLWKYNNKLIASGSFTDMASVANTAYIAQYDLTANTWSSVGGGLGSGISNAFGTSFSTFGNDLIVGGFFANAAGVADTKSIARWDGTAYHSLRTGWAFDSVNAVWSLLTTDAIGGQNRVYIGGGFDTIAGMPAGCIASWDGTTLRPLASSMTLVGINPIVPALATFDDGQGGGTQLYIGGRFSAVDGVPANMIARWNGTTWSAVGTTLVPRNAAAEIDTMLVFDDGTGPALYVGGTNLRVNGEVINRATAKWNGTTWSAVGQALTGRTWSLAAFDDGAGTKLYAAGTQAGVGFIYRLEGGTWVPVDGGASAQAFRLFVDGNTMYVGGSFTSVGGQAANRIVARRGCVPVTRCLADVAGAGPSGTTPDGIVDGSDFVAFINSFSAGDVAVDPIADVVRDSIIDGDDFIAFINAFGAGC